MRPPRQDAPLDATPELPRRDSIIVIGMTTLLVALILIFTVGSI